MRSAKDSLSEASGEPAYAVHRLFSRTPYRLPADTSCLTYSHVSGDLAAHSFRQPTALSSAARPSGQCTAGVKTQQQRSGMRAETLFR